VLVLGRDHGELVAVPDSIGDVFHDIEDATRSLSVSTARHALAQRM
jgi:hypothetical protein